MRLFQLLLLSLCLSLSLSGPVRAAQLVPAKTEIEVGEEVEVRVTRKPFIAIITNWDADGALDLVKDKTKDDVAWVRGVRTGTGTVSMRLNGSRNSIELTVRERAGGKPARDEKDAWHTKIEGMAKVLGHPDLDTRIVRMLAEVGTGDRTAREFYADLAKMNADMFDVIRVRSRLVDGNPAFARDVLGTTFSAGGTDVEMNLLSWRRAQTLAAIDVVVKRFIAAGRIPANGFSLIISHVGKWASQSPNALTFTGDIDFSFVSLDEALAMEMKREFGKVIQERTGLDPKSFDAVATAHGKAGLEVYIGKHGMAFAEEQMKINEIVDMSSGERKSAELGEVARTLATERSLADAQGLEVPKPAANTEPGLSMEMVRHFGHDIVAPKIFDVTNAVVKAAKYLDRSYKSLDKAGGTPADADLAAFARDITE